MSSYMKNYKYGESAWMFKIQIMGLFAIQFDVQNE